MNTRYHCPACNKRDKTFIRYIDTETGEHLHPSVGRCNRESNCAYHYTPKQYFQDNNLSIVHSKSKSYYPTQDRTLQLKPGTIQNKASSQPAPYSTISDDLLIKSLQLGKTLQQISGKNHFIKYLANLFGHEITSQLIDNYFLGSSHYWPGSTVFWQVDSLGNIRTGKIMLYDAISGKRVKVPFNHIHWAHKVLGQPEFILKQCLFGEHLLVGNNMPVAIVESEKTAIIASVYLPRFIWLAVGSLNNLNAEKCQVLKGRKVFLFPDLNGFDKWKAKADSLSHLAKFTISNLLERRASDTEREQGFDLADYLVKLDYKEFV